MKRLAHRTRDVLLLAGWLLATAGSTAESPAFELEPALTLKPERPRAGEVVEVVLAEDLLAPGRTLTLRDAVRDRPFEERTLGRQGLRTLRVVLPPDLRELVLELRDGRTRLLRHPAAGALAVRPPAVREPDAGSADCLRSAPEAEADRAALLAWLADCPLDHADLRDRDLSGVDLAGRNLRRADLRGADLADARLAGADLSGANLLGARLDGTDLTSANLQLADLTHASLFVTDLAGADLRGADLGGAELTDTSLAGADLGAARFAGTRLRGVDFTGARCPDGSRAHASCTDHLELP